MVKLKIEDFIKRAKEKHGEKYDYSKVEYVNNRTKVCIICPEHGEFWQIPSYHMSGNGCPKCGCEQIWNKRGRTTTEDFIKRAVEVHGDKYDYSKVEYFGIYAKVCIICPEHGEFWQTPNGHLNNKRGCPKCGYKEVWGKRGRITTEEFIKRAKEVHGNKYDYSKVEYKSSRTKVCIICPEHGEFWQTPMKHLSRQGCPKCGLKKIWNKRGRTSIEQYVKEAQKIHGDKYDYSKVDFKRKNSKVCIICPEHGEFWQTLNKHINSKQGCPKCVGKNKTTEDFIEEARKVHGDKYDYSKIQYKRSNIKVCIICHEVDKDGNEHGEFWQTPSNHLWGKTCPKCANEHNVYEMKLLKLIKDNFPQEEIIYQYRNKDVLGKKSIDIYFPKYKIGIEYQGRQHFISVTKFGGLKTLEETQKRDLKKYEECVKNDINLLYFTYNIKEKPEKYISNIFTNFNELKEEINSLINKKNWNC